MKTDQAPSSTNATTQPLSIGLGAQDAQGKSVRIIAGELRINEQSLHKWKQ